MIVRPHIIIENVIDLSQETRRKMNNIYQIQEYKLDNQQLFIFVNGQYVNAHKSIQKIFPQHRVTLNQTKTYNKPINFSNVHNLIPMFSIQFEDPARAAYILPLNELYSQFYIEDNFFYLTDYIPEIKTLKVISATQLQPSNQNPLTRIFVDFEAYNQRKLKHKLQIAPSELGAVAIKNSNLISTYHSFIQITPNTPDTAHNITFLSSSPQYPLLSCVLDQFWTFCEQYRPFVLIAKGKFMEEHILQFYVNEFDVPYSQSYLHSKRRKLNFSCNLHQDLEHSNQQNFKLHCALDDAILLGKIFICDKYLVDEVKRLEEGEFLGVEDLG